MHFIGPGVLLQRTDDHLRHRSAFCLSFELGSLPEFIAHPDVPERRTTGHGVPSMMEWESPRYGPGSGGSKPTVCQSIVPNTFESPIVS